MPWTRTVQALKPLAVEQQAEGPVTTSILRVTQNLTTTGSSTDQLI